MEILSRSEAETTRAAGAVASRLRAPCTVLLAGPLGAGKTVFARSFIRALTGNAAEEVPSPTFTLVQAYDSPHGTIRHFDLYRLTSAEEIYELGWEDAQAGGITLVEWPERLGSLQPKRCMTIHFAPVPGDAGARRITITESAS